MGMGMSRPAFNLHNALTLWAFTPFALLVLVASVAAAVWFLRCDWQGASRGQPRPWSRMVSFLGGLLAVDLALQSPVTSFTPGYFPAHIVQHLLLMVVAPPLLAMGAPLSLYLESRPHGGADRFEAVVQSRPFRVLAHPVPVWFLYYFSMFAFFLTSALNYSMLHMWLMDLVNLGFLLTAMLFWWPLVGADPVPHSRMSPGAKIANLLIGIPVESFLALALISDRRPAASMYTMSGTRAGAALLWVAAEALTAVALVPLVIQWTRSEDRRRRHRYDLRLEAQRLTGLSVATFPPDTRS